MLEPARPLKLLLGLLVPAPLGATDGCCIVPVAPDCPEVEGAAPELAPPVPAFIPAPLLGLAAVGWWGAPA